MLNFYSLYLCLPHCLSLSFLSHCLSVCLSLFLSLTLSFLSHCLSVSLSLSLLSFGPDPCLSSECAFFEFDSQIFFITSFSLLFVTSFICFLSSVIFILSCVGFGWFRLFCLCCSLCCCCCLVFSGQLLLLAF